MNKDKRGQQQERHKVFFEQVSQENQLSMRIVQLNNYLQILNIDLIPTSLSDFGNLKSLVQTVSALIYKIKFCEAELTKRDELLESLRNKHRERQQRQQKLLEQKSSLYLQTDKKLARCQFQLQKKKELLKNKNQKNRKQATPHKETDLSLGDCDLQFKHRKLVQDVQQLCEWMNFENKKEEAAVRLRNGLQEGRQSKLKQVQKNTEKCRQELKQLQEIIKKYNKI